jgi:hypothetical protein
MSTHLTSRLWEGTSTQQAWTKSSPRQSAGQREGDELEVEGIQVLLIPLREIGLGGIVVEPTADLIRLKKELIDATAAFMAPANSGTAAAFATEEPEINQLTIDAVATYLFGHTGEHYSPNVTIGVGTVEYLDALLAAPFPTFTFSAVGVSAYQFGNFGTATKQLDSFKLTQ